MGFEGRGQLVDRLTEQVGNREEACRILVNRGHMRPDGSLTAAGELRNRMTAQERLEDRARRRRVRGR